MSGEAQTTSFMLGTATVMLGAQDQLYNLEGDASIGLVKNFLVSAAPTFVELTQGIQNSLVFSVKTANPVTATMEVYEYTAANLAYAAGLDGSTYSTEVAGASTVATAGTGSAQTPSPLLDLVAVTEFSPGDVIQIGEADDILIRKVASIDATSKALTLDHGINKVIPVGTPVSKVSMVGINSKTVQPFLAAKIAGQLADGTNMTLLLPKVRITKGFSVAFKSDAYGNLPFEFSIYDQVAADPFFADFAGDRARIFKTVQ